MKLCKHQPHRVITDILAPKWSTKEVLINVNKVSDKIDHYILQFVEESPKKVYGWFYLSGRDIRSSKKQPNGSGEVYAVKLSKSTPFIPDKDCKCEQREFSLEY